MVEGRRSAMTRARRHARDRARRRIRRGASVLGVLALGLAGAVIPATTASAASWGIQKIVTSEGPYQPGQQVQFAIQISCSDPNAQPCTNNATDRSADYSASRICPKHHY